MEASTHPARIARPRKAPLAGRGIAALREVPPGTLLGAIAVVVSATVWVLSVQDVQLGRMNDLGVISILPTVSFLALGLLSVSFVLALRHLPVRTGLLLFHVLVLIVMLYGLTAMIEDQPRFPVTYRHAGVAEVIERTGEINPEIDAYFNWPGFFSLSAFLTQLTGYESAVVFGNGAPIFFNLLYLLPLYMILRVVGGDRRFVWLGIWLFYISNWVSQDYFAPQAIGYFMFLTIVALVLHWLYLPPPAPARDHPPPRGISGRARAALTRFRDIRQQSGRLPEGVPTRHRAAILVLAVVIFAALVPTHQLTPFAALTAVVLLVLAGRLSARGLPTLMTVLVLTWMTYMTVAYLSGHIGQLTEAIGQLNSILSSNVSDRLRGSDQHLIVAYMRLLMSAALWALAFMGAVRMWRQGRDITPFALLALAPFLLLAIQPYGGELMLRAFLFSLPFAVFFAASLFYPPYGGSSRLATPAVMLVSLALLGGFLVTRYGNERADYITDAESEAVERLYAVAPLGSQLVATVDFSWKYRDYDRYHYRLLSTLDEWKALLVPEGELPVEPAGRSGQDGRVAALADAILSLPRRNPDKPQFVILTRSQKASVDLMGTGPPGTLDRLNRTLGNSSRFETVYRNRDGIIYRALPGNAPVSR